MKKSVIALALAGALLLPGCASLLERDYTSITPHNTAPVTEGDPSILRADSYQELVNALVYFVSLHQEDGTVRLYKDWEDVDASLDAACMEVVKEDPLGAYAVDFIKYDVAPMLSYSEATVEIGYRRTKEQIDSIVSATGATAIRSELETALSRFAPECALRISYFDRDEAYIRSLARQAFHDDPMSALDFPDLDVYIYPNRGRQRIVELSLSYHLSREELLARKELLAREATLLSRTVPFSTGDSFIRSAAAVLLNTARYSPDGGSTAWHALTEHAVDSEGMALAFSALCQQLHIPCQVVEGYLGLDPHCWNVVQTDAGWRHMDLTVAGDALLLDDDLYNLDYSWTVPSIPRCVPESPAEPH